MRHYRLKHGQQKGGSSIVPLFSSIGKFIRPIVTKLLRGSANEALKTQAKRFGKLALNEGASALTGVALNKMGINPLTTPKSRPSTTPRHQDRGGGSLKRKKGGKRRGGGGKGKGKDKGRRRGKIRKNKGGGGGGIEKEEEKGDDLINESLSSPEKFSVEAVIPIDQALKSNDVNDKNETNLIVKNKVKRKRKKKKIIKKLKTKKKKSKNKKRKTIFD